MAGGDSLPQSGPSSRNARQAGSGPPSRMLSSKAGRKPFSILPASLLTRLSAGDRQIVIKRHAATVNRMLELAARLATLAAAAGAAADGMFTTDCLSKQAKFKLRICGTGERLGWAQASLQCMLLHASTAAHLPLSTLAIRAAQGWYCKKKLQIALHAIVKPKYTRMHRAVRVALRVGLWQLEPSKSP